MRCLKMAVAAVLGMAVGSVHAAERVQVEAFAARNLNHLQAFLEKNIGPGVE